MGFWEILHDNSSGLLAGLIVTFKLSCWACFVGVSAGIAIAISSVRFPKLIGMPTSVLTFIVTSVPVLCLLFFFYYPVPYWIGLPVDPFTVTAGTLAAVNALLVAAFVRPALANFPRGYIDAAYLTGLRSRTIVWRITLPLLFLNLLSPLLGLQVVIIQATIFGSLISVNDIFRVVQRINAGTYQLIPSYAVLALLFLVLCAPLNLLAIIARKRLSYLSF